MKKPKEAVPASFKCEVCSGSMDYERTAPATKLLPVRDIFRCADCWALKAVEVKVAA